MSQCYIENSEKELQTAVLLCTDFSFNSKNVINFSPIGQEHLIFLHLKIDGKSLLENALITLKDVGVKIIFLTAYFHDLKSIKKHIEETKFKSILKLRIEFIEVSGGSEGTALRDLFRTGEIRENFLLYRVNSYCDPNKLSNAIEDFLVRQSTHKLSQFMTIVYSETPMNSEYRNENDNFLILFDNTKHLLFHKSNPSNGINFGEHISHMLSAKNSFRCRYDILDPKIQICTTEILKLASNNPELMMIEDDIISAIIDSQKFLNSIYIHILSNDKFPACYINSLRLFYCVIKEDFQSRITLKQSSSQHSNMYFASKSSVIHESCNIFYSNISSNSEIDENCIISKSFIGNGNKINKNVTITNSIIGDNNTIEEGVKITNSFIDQNVFVGRNTFLESGCIIGSDVNISNSSHFKSNTLLSKLKPSLLKTTEENDDYFDKKNDQELKNFIEETQLSNSINYIWKIDLFKTNVKATIGQDIADIFPLTQLSFLDLLDDLLESSEFKSSSNDEDLCNSDSENIKISSTNIQNSLEDTELIEEIQALTLESIQTPEFSNNKILEMKSMRLAYDVSDSDLFIIMLPVIIEFLALNNKRDSTKELESYITSSKILNLFETFLSDPSDHINTIIFEKIFEFTIFNDVLPVSKIVNPLKSPLNFCSYLENSYQLDIFDFEVFPSWYQKAIENYSTNSDALSILNHPRLKAFVKWLEEEEEENE